MNPQRLQQLQWKGYIEGALRIGNVYSVWRPISAAVALGTLIATLPVAIAADNYKFLKANPPGKEFYQAMMDGSLLVMGDYLVLAGYDTHFVCGLDLGVPILTVRCNRVVWIVRGAAPVAVGAVGYSGRVTANDVYVLGGQSALGWPASIVIGAKNAAETELPTSVADQGVRITLPASVPIIINSGDSILDDLGRRYLVVGAELSSQAWRLNAHEVHA